MTVYTGGCACRAVEFEVDTGVAPFMFNAVCHCMTCRKMANSSAVHVIGCPKESVKITKGDEQLKTFVLNETFSKRFCGECGTSIIQWPNKGSFYGVHPANFDLADRFPKTPEEFKPTVHVHFENAFVPDLFRSPCAMPKFNDLPSAFGGSGKLLE